MVFQDNLFCYFSIVSDSNSTWTQVSEISSRIFAEELQEWEFYIVLWMLRTLCWNCFSRWEIWMSKHVSSIWKSVQFDKKEGKFFGSVNFFSKLTKFWTDRAFFWFLRYFTISCLQRTESTTNDLQNERSPPHHY